MGRIPHSAMWPQRVSSVPEVQPTWAQLVGVQDGAPPSVQPGPGQVAIGSGMQMPTAPVLITQRPPGQAGVMTSQNGWQVPQAPWHAGDADTIGQIRPAWQSAEPWPLQASPAPALPITGRQANGAPTNAWSQASPAAHWGRKGSHPSAQIA